MTTLYIIGNGFDLFHGLKTHYSDYRDFLQENNPTLKEEFETSPFLLRAIDEKVDWSNIEESLKLGNLDELIFKAIDSCRAALDREDPDYDEARCCVEIETQFVKDFVGPCLKDWLSTIDLKEATHEVSFAKESFFVTFNYTNLLEERYSISSQKILHIHGKYDGCCSATLDEMAPSYLQFGCPENNAESQTEWLEQTCVGPDFGYHDDYHYGIWVYPCIKELERLCRKAAKQPSTNYELLTKFLHGKSFESICVFGHSYYGVDFPYYRDILLPKYKDLPWSFVGYGDEDTLSAKTFCRLNNLSISQIVDTSNCSFLDLT